MNLSGYFVDVQMHVEINKRDKIVLTHQTKIHNNTEFELYHSILLICSKFNLY